MSSFFKGKNILVTGATGSIGSEIVRQLLQHDPKVVRVYSRDEHKQFLLQQELGVLPNVRYLLGNVRDSARLESAAENIDLIFHAAAYKHVTSCEYNSFEAVKTNVLGTQNVIDVAMRQGVERVLLVSTDKAVSPPNVMGATKLLAEKLMISAMHSKGSRKTQFACVRFGNVLGSRGSVIPVFASQIKKGGPVTVTDPEMLRFFMSIESASKLTLNAMEQMSGGEVFILKMPVIRLGDLAEVLIAELGNGSVQTEIMGARLGEKTNEVLMTHEEARYSEETDSMFIVRALHKLPGENIPDPKIYEGTKEYDSSSVTPLSKEDILALLKESFSDLSEITQS
ncbi:MAG: hypothetical protein CMB80_00665 [Flammeovirgaceae bacterium]|nr:hypothetical protein [Flammeovirgaceae bacterium]|tara:strand:- start:1429 stop:2448 length:1020 start_codon:yes stop_codon:yes gene_type:complete